MPVAAFKCAAASPGFTAVGYYLADRAAQWRTQGKKTQWNSITDNASATAYVECRGDAGVHGDGVNVTKRWAADGNNGPWTANAAQAIAWANPANNAYVFYGANYLNWLYGPATTSQSRLDIVKQVATSTITQLAASSSVNVGLMHTATTPTMAARRRRPKVAWSCASDRLNPGGSDAHGHCLAQRGRLHAALGDLV